MCGCVSLCLCSSSRPNHFVISNRRPCLSFRRDPYDYPTHSRPMPREAAPYTSHDPRVQQSGTQSQQINPRYYHTAPRSRQQHQAAARQDMPPSPAQGRRGQADRYRQASPGRYGSPDRYNYGDERQPDPRRKNPMIGAVWEVDSPKMKWTWVRPL